MTFTRIVFMTRLSSLGDILIATRAVKLLQLNGYYPVFVTSKTGKELPVSLFQSQAFICLGKDKESQFYFNQTLVTENEFIKNINQISVEKKPLFLDLQKTSRSKNAKKQVQKLFFIENSYSVSKRTFYRFFLILMAFFCFSQKRKKKKFEIQPPTEVGGIFETTLDSSRIFGIGKQPGPKGPGFIPPVKKVKSIHELQQEVIEKICAHDEKEIISLPSHSWNSPQRTRPLFRINLSRNKPYFTLPKEKYICLFPGASSFIKMWPKENFKYLIELLLEKTNYALVICGSENEINLGDYLSFPKNKRVINLVEKTSFKQTLNLISNSSYVVTNDSFPAHAAQAFEIPATVLFGATSPYFGFAPKAPQIHVETLNLACSPCTRHGNRQCPYKNLKCLTGISANHVFKQILQKEKGNTP